MNYPYEENLYNKYLNDSKTVKAKTLFEFNIKKQKILERWKLQEKSKRSKDAIEDMKVKAELEDRESKDKIERYSNILIDSLNVDPKLKWKEQLNNDVYKDFTYKENKPSLEEISANVGVPNKSIAEYIFTWLKNRRLKLEDIARAKFESELQSYNDKKIRAYNKYLSEKQKFEDNKRDHNNSIFQWKSNFELGVPDAVESYINAVLLNSNYPENFIKEFETQFIPDTKTVIVSYYLPNTEEIPKICGYKYLITSKQIKAIELNKKDYQCFYENIILQTALKTLNEIFKSTYKECIENIVFNGWIKGIDKATGKDYTSCIFSINISRSTFENINLDRIDPKACVRQLKGIMAGPLYNLSPIKPILDINKSDKRFVESKDILSKLNSIPNLASMNWEDFEHLIRQLFEKILSNNGSEVKVTQPSRDGGIDVIAFDPNPITGGKFIIQAKRYNNVVPVSAARDLYGALIKEGATKGILVTTSYFSNDTLDFIKDLPISLIDGSNLIYLFQEYGYDVRIALKEQNN